MVNVSRPPSHLIAMPQACDSASNELSGGEIDEILYEINKKNPLSVDFESDKYLFGDNKYVDQVEWNNGIYVVETEDETVVLLEILDVLEEQPKKLSEIKGKVISDYQNYLEKKCLD